MEALRSFSAYAKTTATNLIAKQCRLVNMDGNLTSGAAGLFLQIHDKIAPVNGDVPLRSYYLASGGIMNFPSIFQELGPVNFVNGLSVGISTTETTYTAAVATYDVFGEIEEYETPIPALTTSASGAGVNSLSVVSDLSSNAASAIYSITTTGAVTTPRWLQIHPKVPTAGDVPLLSIPMFTFDGVASYVVAQVNRSFGTKGFRHYAVDLAGVRHYGFQLYASSTGGTFTAVVDNELTITAKYNGNIIES